MTPRSGGAAPPFRHDEAGTSEPDWLLDERWDAVPAVSADEVHRGVDRVVVLAAHPDDEVLGAGALLAELASSVGDIVVVLATDGEGSHPPGAFSGGLGQLRRAEARRGLHHLAPAARLEHLALPDGRLSAYADQLDAALRPLLSQGTLLLAPWRHDGHTDHDTAGRVASGAAEYTGAQLLEYPIWLWHWGIPDDLPWEDLLVVNPAPAALHAKRAAIAEHRSQLLPQGLLVEQGPMLGPHVLRRFERVVETFVGSVATSPPSRDRARVETFEAMYDRGEDPWGLQRSWYEERKRALTTAVLGNRRYHSVLEVGCATGVLTRVLARRAEQVTAVDVSARALQVAGQASDVDNVSWVHGGAPEAVPEGPFDLVVLSEVGYFLTGSEWLTTLRRVRSALQPGGEVVLVHWRRRPDGIPLDGPLAQQQARVALGLPVHAMYADADVEIDVLAARPSLAQQEGLA